MGIAGRPIEQLYRRSASTSPIGGLWLPETARVKYKSRRQRQKASYAEKIRRKALGMKSFVVEVTKGGYILPGAIGKQEFGDMLGALEPRYLDLSRIGVEEQN